MNNLIKKVPKGKSLGFGKLIIGMTALTFLQTGLAGTAGGTSSENISLQFSIVDSVIIQGPNGVTP